MKINFELPDHITFLSLERVPSKGFPVIEITVKKIRNKHRVKNIRRVVLDPYTPYDKIGHEIKLAVSDLDLVDGIDEYLKKKQRWQKIEKRQQLMMSLFMAVGTKVGRFLKCYSPQIFMMSVLNLIRHLKEY